MDWEGVSVVVSAIVSVAGGGLLIVPPLIGRGRKVFERRRARAALRSSPGLDASSREGTVHRLTGTIRAVEEPLIAPLSGRACVIARSRVRVGPEFARLAKRPLETISIVPFVLDCGESGDVLVDGKRAELDVAPISTLREHFDVERRLRFLGLHGIHVSARDMARVPFDETIVEVGARVSIAGLLMRDPTNAPPTTGERSFRDGAATTLRLAGDADHPLVIGIPVD